MEVRDFSITRKAAKILSFEFCAPNTGTFQCTSYPVFSIATHDGTTRYETDTPLRQLSPAGSVRTENFPSVSYHAASGTGTITFNYGLTFTNSPKEHEAGSTPRRYKYFLHLAGAPPGTAYSAAYTANSGMVLGGTINVIEPTVTAVTSVVTVCSVGVA